MNKNEVVSLKLILGLFVIVYIFNIIYFLYDSIANDADLYGSEPWTFYWLWILIALLILIGYLLKIKVNFMNIIISSPIIIIFIFIGGILNKIVPDLDRFYAIDTIAGDDRYIYSDEIESLEYKYFWEGDIVSKEKLERTLNSRKEIKEFGEYFYWHPYIFWQTGVSMGYSYDTPYSFMGKIKYFMIVGPMTLLELFIKSLLPWCLTLLLSISWYRRHKKHFIFQEVVT